MTAADSRVFACLWTCNARDGKPGRAKSQSATTRVGPVLTSTRRRYRPDSAYHTAGCARTRSSPKYRFIQLGRLEDAAPWTRVVACTVYEARVSDAPANTRQSMAPGSRLSPRPASTRPGTYMWARARSANDGTSASTCRLPVPTPMQQSRCEVRELNQAP
jgi:hypothetical protein